MLVPCISTGARKINLSVSQTSGSLLWSYCKDRWEFLFQMTNTRVPHSILRRMELTIRSFDNLTNFFGSKEMRVSFIFPSSYAKTDCAVCIKSHSSHIYYIVLHMKERNFNPMLRMYSYKIKFSTRLRLQFQSKTFVNLCV